MYKKFMFQIITAELGISRAVNRIKKRVEYLIQDEAGDVPGWVLVVLMTTGLVTAIWTIAQPRISSILKNSLDNMNSIR
jgi:uncharacterized membrane protein YqjE